MSIDPQTSKRSSRLIYQIYFHEKRISTNCQNKLTYRSNAWSEHTPSYAGVE